MRTHIVLVSFFGLFLSGVFGQVPPEPAQAQEPTFTARRVNEEDEKEKARQQVLEALKRHPDQRAVEILIGDIEARRIATEISDGIGIKPPSDISDMNREGHGFGYLTLPVGVYLSFLGRDQAFRMPKYALAPKTCGEKMELEAIGLFYNHTAAFGVVSKEAAKAEKDDPMKLWEAIESYIAADLDAFAEFAFAQCTKDELDAFFKYRLPTTDRAAFTEMARIYIRVYFDGIRSELRSDKQASPARSQPKQP